MIEYIFILMINLCIEIFFAVLGLLWSLFMSAMEALGELTGAGTFGAIVLTAVFFLLYKCKVLQILYGILVAIFIGYRIFLIVKESLEDD